MTGPIGHGYTSQHMVSVTVTANRSICVTDVQPVMTGHDRKLRPHVQEMEEIIINKYNYVYYIQSILSDLR
jgi:hypothetical protein